MIFYAGRLLNAWWIAVPTYFAAEFSSSPVTELGQLEGAERYALRG